MPSFALAALPNGTKTTTWLPVAPRADGNWYSLPLLIVKGVRPGPVLLVLGAVHGDEYEGVEAIPLAYADVDPNELSGTLVMVPVCNLPAYEAGQRNSPIDGMNLARVFPGKASGTVTERIAYALTDHLLHQADFLLDLHSGGIAYEIPTLIGYLHDEGELGTRSRAAAQAFGAPVLWGHPMPIPDGRTISAATTLGIPWLYTEAPGGFAHATDIACFRRGIHNVMRHLQMLSNQQVDALQDLRPLFHFVGDGNLDIVTMDPVGGLFRPTVQVPQRVTKGESLGNITDLFGNLSATVVAEMDSVVIMLRRLQRVHVGEGLVQVTNTLDEYNSK